MAERYQDVFGYKTGDTASFAVRSIARVVNAGNGVYTYVEADKPILSSKNTCHVSISTYVAWDITGTVALVPDLDNITVIDIVKNKITFVIPTNALTAGKLYYIEAMANVQF